MSHTAHLSVKANLQELQRAVLFCANFAIVQNCSKKEAFAIELSVEEALSNIIKHGYKQNDGPILITCHCHQKFAIEIELKDYCFPYDPTLHPKVTMGVQHYDQGFGLQLIFGFMDKIIYTRKNDANVLRLLKKFSNLHIS